MSTAGGTGDAPVGREPELDLIGAAIAATGAPALLFEGSFGSGKTALLDAAARLAADRGVAARRVRATESDRAHPRALVPGLAGEADPGADVRTLATRLADEAVLLLVDDVHHADDESLALL